MPPTGKKKQTTSTAEQIGTDLTHLDGCPENEDRVETYEDTKPDGTKVQVTRCMDCGAHAVSDVAGRSNPREGFDEGE